MALLQPFVQGVVEETFRTGRKLGQGGFATVYLATEKKTGIHRALKFFPIKEVTEDVVNECRCDFNSYMSIGNWFTRSLLCFLWLTPSSFQVTAHPRAPPEHH